MGLLPEKEQTLDISEGIPNYSLVSDGPVISGRDEATTEEIPWRATLTVRLAKS